MFTRIIYTILINYICYTILLVPLIGVEFFMINFYIYVPIVNYCFVILWSLSYILKLVFGANASPIKSSFTDVIYILVKLYTTNAKLLNVRTTAINTAYLMIKYQYHINLTARSYARLFLLPTWRPVFKRHGYLFVFYAFKSRWLLIK